MGAQCRFSTFQQPWKNEVVRCRQQEKLSSRSRQALSNGDIGATVGLVLYQPDAIMSPAEVRDDLEAVIGRAIIDEQDFHRRDSLCYKRFDSAP